MPELFTDARLRLTAGGVVMARIRSVKPTTFTNEELAELDGLDRFAFIGLWTQADRRGRMEDRPKRLKAAILPYDDVDFEAMLRRLQDAGFILRYEAVGVRVIQVLNFEKHQRITGAEAQSESELPPPPTEGDQPEKHLGNTQEAPETTGREWKGKEGKGVGVATSSRSAPPTDETEIILTFPTNGKPAEWRLRQAFVDELAALYPSLDVVAECRKSLAKIEAGAVTRKTANGMKRFLFSWMDRGTNGGSAYGNRPPSSPPQKPLTDAERFLAGESLANDRA
jgi:hypothetical protein